MRRQPWYLFVQAKGNLRLLDAVAQRYGTRPSDILGIGDPWAAYQLDVATMLAGMGEGKAKGQSYASLGGMAKRMKVPESGVW